MAPSVEEQRQPARRRRRRTTAPKPRARGGRGGLRGIYFGAAALWGFLAGTGSILIGLSLAGAPFQPGRFGIVLIVVAAGLALVGGLVSAAAYRQARERKRH